MPKPGKFEPFDYNEVYPKYAGTDFGQQMCDWQERINMERMRNERGEKLRAAMKAADVPVMLLLSPVNIRYATGVNISSFAVGLGYAILPLEGEPIIYGHGTCRISDGRHVTWIKPENYRISIPASVGPFSAGLWTQPSARQYQLEKFADQIKDGLVELGLANEVLTLDANDAGGIAALEKVGIKCTVRGDIAIRAQEIKTRDEIECLRIAASIVDVIMWEIAKFAEPGKTDYEVAGYAPYIAMKHGAELARRAFVASGPFTWPNPRMVGGRMLRPGDIFYVDITQMSWEGYLTCYYRTFSVMTEPSQAAKDAYKRTYDWIYNSLEDCKPGNTTADMARHWPDEKEYWGIDPDYAWGDNVMHGIGMTMYGPPHGCRAWCMEYPYELQAGHVFAIETQDGIGDGQGVRLEEMVVITEDGYEVLSRFPPDVIPVCPLR